MSNPTRTRTCIATREARPDTQLLRVVVDPDDPTRIIPDPGRKLPGRGAWITPTTQACELAEQRRAFGRALRVSANVDTSAVRKYIAEEIPHSK
ncbi:MULTISPECIES: YlxR family protein [unclassified Corynebacterium]|uniref:YlxR family protein n=1 Tax=unclassified Corynebacterium TaxID=2624378 RepID=UPI001B33E3BC|nr:MULTISPECIES: YlxR family protein [unclassified Corynebacterium]MBP3947493.1 YlxR family protein [Corynebacterium sp. Marseille-P3884]MCT1450537.1 YlxR family protein [Corynebacterium sp. p3-SID1194]